MSQFKLGYYFVVQSIHQLDATRSSITNRGVVIMVARRIRSGHCERKGVLSDGRKFAFKGFNRPSSILVTEAFLIENGKIRRVEMIGPSATYHTEFGLGPKASAATRALPISTPVANTSFRTPEPDLQRAAESGGVSI